MFAYYNEKEPYAAEWLRNLIAGGHIAPGVVDDRSIEDICPADLVGFTQCHFFAGIGVWSLALRLAGWPDSRPVWTGSCPCQPFSTAGEGAGFDDERHLWPAWHHLIRECRPPVIFGEQVEAAINHGWLDLVHSDLEAEGYTFAPVGIPAAGVGAPHIRHRLWFVADANKVGHHGDRARSAGRAQLAHCGNAGQFADRMVHPDSAGSPARDTAAATHRHRNTVVSAGWDDIEWLPCADGRSRPTQPGLFPLAHGSFARVGRLRAYGNAIVPQVAAEVIRAYMTC